MSSAWKSSRSRAMKSHTHGTRIASCTATCSKRRTHSRSVCGTWVRMAYLCRTHHLCYAHARRAYSLGSLAAARTTDAAGAPRVDGHGSKTGGGSLSVQATPARLGRIGRFVVDVARSSHRCVMPPADEPAGHAPSLLQLVPDRQQLERERLARAAARERACNTKKRTRSVSPDAPCKAMPGRSAPAPAHYSHGSAHTMSNASRYTPPEPMERFWTGAIKVRLTYSRPGHLQPLRARLSRRHKIGAVACPYDAR